MKRSKTIKIAPAMLVGVGGQKGYGVGGGDKVVPVRFSYYSNKLTKVNNLCAKGGTHDPLER